MHRRNGDYKQVHFFSMFDETRVDFVFSNEKFSFIRIIFFKNPNKIRDTLSNRMPNENLTITKVNKMPLNSRLKVPTIGEMIRSITTIRHEWPYKSPFQKWCYFYGIGRAAFSLNRFPLFQDSQVLHWITYYPIFYIGTYFILVLYTAYYYIVERGELTKCLPCTCMLSILLAVSFGR